MSEEEILAHEQAEEDRKKAKDNFTKSHVMEVMRLTAASEGAKTDISGMNIDRRSRRVMKGEFDQHSRMQSQHLRHGEAVQAPSSH